MAADPQDTPRQAGQVVRRVLLRRNITVDALARAAFTRSGGMVHR